MSKNMIIVSDAGPLIALAKIRKLNILPGLFEKVKITGTGAVLVAAKKKGIIEKVAPALDELLEFGYRISGALRKRILELAEEAE